VCVCVFGFFSSLSLFSFLEKMNVGAPLTPVSPAPHLRQETRAAPTLTLSSSSFFFLSFSLFFFPPFTYYTIYLDGTCPPTLARSPSVCVCVLVGCD
jgi:hypothetical protein